MLGKVAGMPKATTATEHRREQLPLVGRSMELRGFQRAADASTDAAAPLTAQIVFTTGAPVVRYDYLRERPYLETLVVEEGAMRMGRLQAGAPLLNSHASWDLEAQLGVVENPVIEAGAGIADVTFSRRESVAGYVQDVADRIIRNVSVGYVRHAIEMVPPVNDAAMWAYRVTDWEPYEVSLVAIPADAGSQIRSDAGTGADGQRAQPEADPANTRFFPCDFIEVRALSVSPTVGNSAAISNPEELSMPASLAAGGTPAAIPATLTVEQRAAQLVIDNAAPATTAATATALLAQQAEQTRSADISDLCVRHGVATLATGLIRSGGTIEAARAAVLDEISRRDLAAGGHRNVGDVRSIGSEFQTRMAGLEEAVQHRVDPRVTLTDNGRQYRGMTVLELGRQHLEAQGVNTRGLDRMSLATSMLQHRSTGYHGTSDFAALFANVANKRLRNAYDQNAGSYAMWARRAPNAPDFKAMSVVQLSGAPDLLRTNEHGEFKYGTLTEGGETYGVITYGRVVSLSRQAIVNDDLRGFDRLVGAFGSSASRLENRTVYAQLTANAALADGVALFHAGHSNLGTGAGSALQQSALTAGRTAMRLQKGMQSEELNITPNYLIVPAALEQTAYQQTSSNYVPAKQSDVNEFRTGGRTALEAIVEPLLDANSATAWYLAASNSQIDTVEYCYLDGAEGPVIESETGFEVDGISYKCRLDFAAKAIDYRGIYKSAGA